MRMISKMFCEDIPASAAASSIWQFGANQDLRVAVRVNDRHWHLHSMIRLPAWMNGLLGQLGDFSGERRTDKLRV
jgi:hypothetical protein